MTSLAEAYEGHVGEVVSPERLYLGVGLFLAGVLLTAVGMIVATTDVTFGVGLDRMGAWRRAGVMAGVGVPATIGGVFTVLPSSKRIKAAATIGAGISLFGIALFWYAYPTHWAGYGKDLTLHVSSIYFFGTMTSVWCLFVGIANIKQRNDPGGTVSLKVQKENGETKVVEVDKSDLEDGELGDVAGAGGVGLLGGTPDGSVQTQTNDPGTPTGSGATGGSSVGSGAGTGYQSSVTNSADPTAGGSTDGWTSTETTHPAQRSPATSDGGREDTDIQSLSYDGELKSTRDSARQYADRYCGNCQHFQYVRTETGMTPHCTFHGENMDDMEACDDWDSNH